MDFIKLFFLLTTVLHCNGIRILDHDGRILRRMYLPNEKSVILGAPTYPYHLPQAEPIMPGHTLLRPSLGMLKSAVKFPHKELEDGSGVYGHYENIGIKYDGKNERVLYTGFRRKGMSPEMFQEYYRPKKPVFNVNSKSIKSSKNMLKRLRKASKYGKIVFEKNERPLGSFNEAKWRENKNKPFWYEDFKKKPAMMLDNKMHNIDAQKPNRRYSTFSAEEGNSGKRLTSSEAQVHRDLAEILRILKSMKNLQEPSQNQNVDASSSLSVETDPPDSDTENNGQINEKTKSFWETKDAFNHIKINPMAPELRDLLPEAPEKEEEPNWWYFQQSDFKDFEKRKV